jgi:hypothetical protein
MTRNQIDYWNMVENKRHNVVTEGETNRHNVATEGIDIGKLSESARHNVVTENIDIGKLGETTRHNVASEGIERSKVGLGYAELGETTRHNLVVEGQAGTDLNIKQQDADTRSATVTETQRHNQQTEKFEDRKTNAAVAKDLAEANYKKMLLVWDEILKSDTHNINEKELQKVRLEMDKIASEIRLNRANTTTAYWNSLNGSISSLGSVLNGLGRLAGVAIKFN